MTSMSSASGVTSRINYVYIRTSQDSMAENFSCGTQYFLRRLSVTLAAAFHRFSGPQLEAR